MPCASNRGRWPLSPTLPPAAEPAICLENSIVSPGWLRLTRPPPSNKGALVPEFGRGTIPPLTIVGIFSPIFAEAAMVCSSFSASAPTVRLRGGEAVARSEGSLRGTDAFSSGAASARFMAVVAATGRVRSPSAPAVHRRPVLCLGGDGEGDHHRGCDDVRRSMMGFDPSNCNEDKRPH